MWPVYGLDCERIGGFDIPPVQRAVPFLHSIQAALEPTQPPLQWAPAPLRQGREADHLHLVGRLKADLYLHCATSLHDVVVD
jgi:hypothetical protein